MKLLWRRETENHVVLYSQLHCVRSCLNHVYGNWFTFKHLVGEKITGGNKAATIFRQDNYHKVSVLQLYCLERKKVQLFEDMRPCLQSESLSNLFLNISIMYKKSWTEHHCHWFTGSLSTVNMHMWLCMINQSQVSAGGNIEW